MSLIQLASTEKCILPLPKNMPYFDYSGNFHTFSGFVVIKSCPDVHMKQIFSNAIAAQPPPVPHSPPGDTAPGECHG